MSFGRKLRILRVLHGMDQQAMSKLLHISQPVYSRYENDVKRIYSNDPFAERVAKIFDVPVKWVLGESTEHSAYSKKIIGASKLIIGDLSPEVQMLLKQYEQIGKQLIKLIEQQEK